MSSDCCLPNPPSAVAFHPDEIVVYGVKLNVPQNNGSVYFPFFERVAPPPPAIYRLKIDMIKNSNTPVPPTDIAMAMVYGYGYEGHCYRLDKPKLMIFFYHGTDEAAKGCGFEVGQSPSPYTMWRVRKKTDLLELTVSVGTAEGLLLEANLPGRRAPNTYSGHMQVAHRGGRLTDTNR